MGENDGAKKGQRGKRNRWQMGKKKSDRGEDREFEKERRGSQEAERTSLHSLLIRAVIGQQHDTHLCRNACVLGCVHTRGLTWQETHTHTYTHCRLRPSKGFTTLSLNRVLLSPVFHLSFPCTVCDFFRLSCFHPPSSLPHLLSFTLSFFFSELESLSSALFIFYFLFILPF